MTQNLVSVITPCYNTAPYLPHLLESLLQQDYPHMEIIAVNDGSTDDTQKVLESYRNKFEAKGYSYKCLSQSNAGQSAAVNNALKLVRGEFLICPDSDDWYNTPTAISTFVNTLRTLPKEYAEVRCVSTIVPEDDHSKSHTPAFIPDYRDENQFPYCLHDRHFLWGAGNYMVRMSAFDTVNPQREIYVEKRAGQNWQLLLPILYKYKCHTIEQSVHSILERSNSHSRGQFTKPATILEKTESFLNTIASTLNRMDMPADERDGYILEISSKYLRSLFDYACACGLSSQASRYAAQMKSLKITFTAKDTFYLLLAHSPRLNRIARRLVSAGLHACTTDSGQS